MIETEVVDVEEASSHFQVKCAREEDGSVLVTEVELNLALYIGFECRSTPSFIRYGADCQFSNLHTEIVSNLPVQFGWYKFVLIGFIS